jgi:glutamate-ammonia-ligase adenylyltransferase
MTIAGSPKMQSLVEAALRNGVDAHDFVRRLEDLASAAPDPDRALRNLHRIVEAGFSTSLLRDFAVHPVLLSVTFELVGQSDYLADIIVRDPELLRWLTASNVLSKARTESDLESEARQSMGLFGRSERRLDALRRFHRREMLRIGAREILQEADVETVTAELSALADAVASCVVDQAHADLNARFGVDLPHRMAVIALGKLGGGELNFSSDIDLMFVYDEDGDLPHEVGRLHTWHEYHVRFGESIVRALTEFSSEGHLYRVDMRLRPDGRSGPLAMSRAAMMTYYESRGAAWERQMLLKARVIGGAVDVGERFLRDLQPFIFPRTATNAPWLEIGRMKETIERESDVEGNIKLGAGGIRDIEFLVQGLQLLFAGQDPRLRTGHTVRGLERLVAAGHIQRDDGDRLRRSYLFFRSIEHRLQLLHGHQTHQLPQTEVEVQTLGRKLGFEGADEFRRAVAQHRAFVRAQYEAFTRPGVLLEGAPPVGRQALLAASLSATGWPEDMRALAASRIARLLDESATGRAIEAALMHRRHRPWLLRAALLAPRTLEDLSGEPLLVESLLGNADILLRRSDPGWRQFLAEDLRRFRSYNATRSVVRYLMTSSSTEAFEGELSDLADEVLRAVADTTGVPGSGIAVVALGKLGGREMGVGSDLDLVIVFDERRCERSNAESCARALIKGFGTAPSLYKVDFRLRPEGQNAPLAVELQYLRWYLGSRAEPWEFMALSRMRLVWGDRKVASAALRHLRTAVEERSPYSPFYIRKMRSEMEMQRVKKGEIDLKVSSGGIADVEFVAQSTAVRNTELMGLSTRAVIRNAVKRRLLLRSVADPLTEGLLYLRHLETLVRLQSATPLSVLPSDLQVLRSLALGAGFADEKVLLRRTNEIMQQTRKAFRAALTSGPDARRGGR